MENFIFSLNATAPIFLVMILGNILMKTGFLSEEFTRVSDKFVFKVALPALLFYDISTADMSDVFNLKFILFCMFTTIIMFLVIWILTWIFMKDKSVLLYRHPPEEVQPSSAWHLYRIFMVIPAWLL